MSGTCDKCNSRLFAPKKYPQIFAGEGFDEASGVRYQTDQIELDESVKAGCVFCSLVRSHTFRKKSGSPQQAERKIDLWIYGVPFVEENASERPVWDISKLFIDAGTLGCSSYFVYADNEDAAATCVSTRPPIVSIDSEDSFHQAQEWLRECREHHSCSQRSLPLLPSRVLRVLSSSGEPDLCLIEPDSGTSAAFVTLSYCWGAPQPQMLTTHNAATYAQGISLELLPQTIQDAVRLTRKLGVADLWVDSLCIVQDDEQAKAVEIRRMDRIYTDSTMTIRVAGAPNCNVGFLDRPTHGGVSDYQSPYLSPQGVRGTIHLRPWSADTDYDAASEPANQRAWILQETLLPRRLLSVPSAPHPLQWQCGAKRASCGGTPLELVSASGGFNGERLHALSRCPGDAPPDAWRLWTQVLQTYTERRISDPADVLRAVGAVAAIFQHAWDCAYLAGLWQRHIIPGLFWRPWPSGADRRSPDSRSEAWPSWSWASCSEPVIHTFLNLPVRTMLFKLVEVVQEGKDSEDGFEAISSNPNPERLTDVAWRGWLRVKAVLKQGVAVSREQVLLDQDDGGRQVGRAFLDGDTGKPQEVWCMPIADPRAYTEHQPTGLLLTHCGKSDYRRAGLFTLTHMDWFEGCELSVIHLV